VNGIVKKKRGRDEEKDGRGGRAIMRGIE